MTVHMNRRFAVLSLSLAPMCALADPPVGGTYDAGGTTSPFGFGIPMVSNAMPTIFLDLFAVR